MDTQKNRQRLDWLDCVKGIGILFVVIGHVYVEDGFFSRIIHGLNVPLFFLSSGYLHAYKREWEKPKRELLNKKIHSVLQPYFLFSAAVMVWLLVRFFIFGYGSFYEIFHCAVDIFCLEGISVLWFLSALFIGEILYLFSEQWVQKQQNYTGRRRAVLFFLLVFAAHLLIYFVGRIGENPAGVLQKLVRKGFRIAGRGLIAAVFILIGAMIRLWEEKREKKKSFTRQTWIIGLILCSFFAAAGLWYNGLRDFHYLSFGCFLLYLLNGFLGFLACSFFGRLGIGRQIFTFFGKNSLMIMGTHLILLDWINIMAVILSTPAGRYLGDEQEIKLAAVFVGELLLVYGKKWINKNICR